MLIYQRSVKTRRATAQAPQQAAECALDASLLRDKPPYLPEVSELDVVRHYTKLSQKNFSIDTQFYPLGSCTMKYNPRAHRLAWLDAFLQAHPLAPASNQQGLLACLYDLQHYLLAITGMQAIAMSPMAGAQGELAGIMMIKAYHAAKGESERCEMLVPDAAHGTNPASAKICGYQVKQVRTDGNGNVDLSHLKALLSEKTAGIMLTNPSTLGVFEQNIEEIAACVHQAGGLLYYDGANLNAIVGKTTPAAMGFDVVHLNLHKTFSTPHGGGGPGAGPVAVNERLKAFLPIPYVIKGNQGLRFSDETDCPKTIGRLSAFHGNVGVLLRAYIYLCLVGRQGLARIANMATLNANYCAKKLAAIGYSRAYPQRLASHEFIISLASQAKKQNVNAMDVAKRLLDYGVHAPTVYFPTLVAECLLIEPTESESKQTLDAFIAIMKAIFQEMTDDPACLRTAPHRLPVKRLDEIKAARLLKVKECQETAT